MIDKDNVRDLFKDRFKNFEANVDPKVWGNIQSNISSAPVGTSSFIGSTPFWVAAVSFIVVSVLGYNTLFNSVESNNETVSEVVSPEMNKNNATDAKLVEEKDGNIQESSTSEIEIVVEKTLVEEDLKPANTNPVKEHNAVVQNESIEASPDEKEHVIQVQEPVEKELVVNTQKTVSNAPQSIVIEQQSRVVASPMGGNAPLTVSFHSLTSVKKIKWKFDDGTESEEEHPEFTYEEAGVYFVTMLAELEDGTIVMDKAVIEVGEQNQDEDFLMDKAEIFVPNIFTPNYDGENDRLILNVKYVNSFTISIYSVNGKLVYASENSQETWDGTDLHGNKLEDGVFYYLINAIGEDGNVYAPKGYITIKR